MEVDLTPVLAARVAKEYLLPLLKKQYRNKGGVSDDLTLAAQILDELGIISAEKSDLVIEIEEKTLKINRLETDLKQEFK